MRQCLKWLSISPLFLLFLSPQTSFAISREQMKALVHRAEQARTLTSEIIEDIQHWVHDELEEEIAQEKREAYGHKHSLILRNLSAHIKANKSLDQFNGEYILQFKILSIWFLKDFPDDSEQAYWNDFFHRVIDILETLQARLIQLNLLPADQWKKPRSESAYLLDEIDLDEITDRVNPVLSQERTEVLHDSQPISSAQALPEGRTSSGIPFNPQEAHRPLPSPPIPMQRHHSSPTRFPFLSLVHPRIQQLKEHERLNQTCRMEWTLDSSKAAAPLPRTTTYGFFNPPTPSTPVASGPKFNPDETLVLAEALAQSRLLFPPEEFGVQKPSPDLSCAQSASPATLPFHPKDFTGDSTLADNLARASAQQEVAARLYIPSRYTLNISVDPSLQYWTAAWHDPQKKKQVEARGETSILEFGRSYRVALSKHTEKPEAFDAMTIAQWFPKDESPLELLGIHHFGVLGIIDVQGDRMVMEHAARILPSTVRDFLSHLSPAQISNPEIVRKALENAFTSSSQHPDVPQHQEHQLVSLDEALRSVCASLKGSPQEVSCLTSGASATIAVFLDQHLYIAQLGDTRATFVPESGKTRRLTVEHYPEHPEETRNIKLRGGFISPMTPSSYPKLDGVLGISRALGYWHAHPPDFTPLHVVRVPEITHINLRENPMKALLLFTKGISHGIGNDDFLGKITSAASEKGTRAVAREIQAHALASGSIDNSLVMILKGRTGN